MGRFITRIELHNATSSDYEELNTAMLKAGFARTITCDEGNVFALPSAEFYKEVSSVIKDVFKEAVSIANSTGRKNWVVTSETVNRMWKLQEII